MEALPTQNHDVLKTDTNHNNDENQYNPIDVFT